MNRSFALLIFETVIKRLIPRRMTDDELEQYYEEYLTEKLDITLRHPENFFYSHQMLYDLDNNGEIIEDTGVLTTVSHFDANVFYQNSYLEPIGKMHDAYGTCTYRLTTGDAILEGMLLNTYGDEDDYPSDIVFCICTVFDGVVEVLDCRIDDTNTIVIADHRYAKIPTVLRDNKSLGIGKRAFYFERDDGVVSLRIDESGYSSDEQYQDCNDPDVVSTPRIKLPLVKM